MYKLTCKLRFTDGATITANIAVDSPLTRSEVKWSGDLDRVSLGERHKICQAARLRSFCKTLAQRFEAKYEEISTGDFDRW